MTAVSTTPRRRWFRFSLRAMLLLVLLLGIVLGWTMHTVRRQAAAVADFEGFGGRVRYADGPWTILERMRSVLGEEQPRNVTQVYLDNSLYFDDTPMAYLREFPHLESLTLDRSRVTDAGLVHLAGLGELRDLSLEGTRVTDAGLVHLQGLNQLMALDLSNTRITDQGLARLQGLSQLLYLGLNGTQVTDAGLVHIRSLTRLQSVDIDHTRVTDSGETEFSGVRPSLLILRSDE